MALSANADYTTGDDWGFPKFSCVVKNSSTIYNGSLVTQDSTTGEVKAFDGTEADRFVGMHFGDTVTGNSTAPRNRAQVKPGGFSLVGVAVTGLSNDASDYGALVYASDDGTFTLTSTGNKLIGKVVADDRSASGQARVFIFPIIDGVVDSAAT